jgi:hypothetical protein
VHNNNAQILQAEQNYAANALFPSSDPSNTAVRGTEGNPYFPFGTTFSCAGSCTSGLATFSGTCSTGPRPGVPSGCTPTGSGAEQVWNEPALGAATGGAPSLLFGVPSYQSGLWPDGADDA